MNPHQKNKVDVSVRSPPKKPSMSIYDGEHSNCGLHQSLNEEEQKLFRLYGKLPNKKDLLQNKLKVSPSLSNNITVPKTHVR